VVARASSKKASSKKAASKKAAAKSSASSARQESARKRRRLLVVDAANAIYRAFFAIPHLRAPDGTPTNAVLGFLNMLNKLIREEQPDYVVVAMDPRGGSFRKRIYPAYKATRDAQPEDLTKQLPLVREAIEAMHVPILEVPDYEADDVIATLVARAPEDVEVHIVSSDKDLMQLVDDRVVLVDGMKDRRYGPEEVEERFGVPPARILDVRALVGDPSDNIPGVKGIGEKGAAKLIAEWGDLDNLLAHVDEIKARRARQALEAHADEARLSRELSTLRADVPLDQELEAFARREPDVQALRALYERLGFNRLVEALDREAGEERAAGAAPGPELDLCSVHDAAGLRAALDRFADAERLVFVSIAEAGSVVDATWVGLAIAPVAPDPAAPARALYVAVDDLRAAQDALSMEGEAGRVPQADAVEALVSFLGSAPAARSWGGVETKRVHAMLGERGCDLPTAFFDAEIASFLLDPAGAHDVAALASQHLGLRLRSWEELAGRGARATPASRIAPDELARWAGEHAAAIAGLIAPLRERLERDELAALFYEVEMPLTAVLARVERAGVRIDEQKLARLSEEYATQLATIEAEIYELAGERFAVNSPRQLQHVLFEKLKLPVVKKTKTGYSTDESVLEQLAHEHELPSRILAWRRLAKLKSTYLDALPPLVSKRSGRLHPTFLQMGAATGRLASTRPNVQNIPIRTPEGIRIREAFVAAEGCLLVSADYSQVELRILAHYSGDESLIDAFSKGEDIHRRTAAEVAGIGVDEVSDEQRARAKAVNFGIIYGSSAFGLANQLGIAQAEAQETIDAYFARYQGVRRFLDETIAEARERGYVTTLLGRRRYLPELSSRNRSLRQAAERMAVNTVIQGSEADLIKRAMVTLQDALDASGLGARMILQVHDELVFEVPRAQIEALSALAVERMRGVYPL